MPLPFAYLHLHTFRVRHDPLALYVADFTRVTYSNVEHLKNGHVLEFAAFNSEDWVDAIYVDKWDKDGLLRVWVTFTAVLHFQEKCRPTFKPGDLILALKPEASSRLLNGPTFR